MVRSRFFLVLSLLAVLALLAACKPVTAPAGAGEAAATPAATAAAAEAPIGMANPASVNCEDKGGKLEIHDETDGQVGICVFPDGSECEEWAFFRGECAPGEQQHGDAEHATGDTHGAGGEDDHGHMIGMPNPASVNCEDKGGTLEMRQDAGGGEYGMCKFSDGSECEEWALFRGTCAPGQNMPAAGAGDMANMPNPASVNCEQQGGTLDIRQDDSGGEYGVCMFPDATECEEWALLRGTCKQGDTPSSDK